MYKTLTFNLAREALGYIVNTYNIKEIKIPYYLCDVVRHALVKEGCKPLFYHIDNNFFPVEEFNKDDYVLYPNYWGICGDNVKKLVNLYPKLIVDNAHAYYNKPSGFACFNAGHKFGHKDSFLWITDYNSNTDNDITIGNPAKERQKLFAKLHEKYNASNLLDINTDSISFMYPLIYPYLAKTTEEADTLARQLKEEGKTVYRYWNPLPKNFLEYKFYSRLVPIPILPY